VAVRDVAGHAPGQRPQLGGEVITLHCNAAATYHDPEEHPDPPISERSLLY
jgi:hypothetical protein